MKLRYKFFFRYFVRGMIWLGVIIGVFLIFKRYFVIDFEEFLNSITDQPVIVFMVFFISEVIVGIIPPEVFMIWSLKMPLKGYLSYILLLSVLSFTAGLIAFWIGNYFHNTRFYDYVEEKLFGRYAVFLRKFGGFIILVAAMTPLPYSGICMLVGSAKYPFKRFILVSLTRFLRFGLYAYVIWHANLI